MGSARVDPAASFAGGNFRPYHRRRKRTGRGVKLMPTFIALLRRDLAAFLLSMTGWVLIGMVLLVSGLSLMVVLEALNREPTHMPVTELFYQTQFFWLIVLMVVPVITMRSFALEKDLGTYETLMTTPIRDSQVVLAKF